MVSIVLGRGAADTDGHPQRFKAEPRCRDNGLTTATWDD